MARDPIKLDVTPGAHSFLDALALVSFKLACGCNRPMTRIDSLDDDDRAMNFKDVGSETECSRHGRQIITRRTTKLAGWANPRTR